MAEEDIIQRIGLEGAPEVIAAFYAIEKAGSSAFENLAQLAEGLSFGNIIAAFEGLATAIGVVAGALTALNVKSAETVASMGFLADLAGTSIERMSSLSIALQGMGVHTETLDTIFKRMGQTIGKQFDEAAAKGRLTFEEMRKGPPTVEEAFLALSERMSQLGNNTEKLRLLAQYGIRASGQDVQRLINAMSQGAGALEDQMRRLQAQGLVLTQENRDAAEKIVGAWNSLMAVIENVATRFGIAFDMSGVFTRIKEFILDNQETIIGFGQTLQHAVVPIIEDILRLLTGRPAEAQWLNDLVQGFQVLGSVASSVLGLLFSGLAQVSQAFSQLGQVINAIFGTDLTGAQILGWAVAITVVISAGVRLVEIIKAIEEASLLAGIAMSAIPIVAAFTAGAAIVNYFMDKYEQYVSGTEAGEQRAQAAHSDTTKKLSAEVDQRIRDMQREMAAAGKSQAEIVARTVEGVKAAQPEPTGLSKERRKELDDRLALLDKLREKNAEESKASVKNTETVRKAREETTKSDSAGLKAEEQLVKSLRDAEQEHANFLQQQAAKSTSAYEAPLVAGTEAARKRDLEEQKEIEAEEKAQEKRRDAWEKYFDFLGQEMEKNAQEAERKQEQKRQQDEQEEERARQKAEQEAERDRQDQLNEERKRIDEERNAILKEIRDNKAVESTQKITESQQQYDELLKAHKKNVEGLNQETNRAAQATADWGGSFGSATIGADAFSNALQGLKSIWDSIFGPAAAGGLGEPGAEMDLSKKLGAEKLPGISNELEKTNTAVQGISTASKDLNVATPLEQGATGANSLTSGVNEATSALSELINMANQASSALDSLFSGGGGGVEVSSTGLATGGLFRGRAGRDQNLVRLSDFEYVIRPEAVQHFGVRFFDFLNAMVMPPGFARGGLFRIPSFATGGPVSSQRPVILNIGGQSIGGITASDSAVRQLERHSITAQVARAGRPQTWKK